jgi:menaquinone-specific isochorismate synthase
VAEAEDWWTGLVSQVVSVSDLDHTPGAGFMAFGSFVFDPATTAARSTMVVPSTVLGRRNGRAWLTQIGTSFVHDDTLPPVVPPVAPRTVSYADGGLTGPQWEAAVAEAVRRITAGDLEKVVLARDLLARASEPIDPRWILARLAERYERCWSYLVDGLVGATPEMLLRRENGLVTSRVLAGTIQRSGDNTRDLASAAALARSSKDLEEHEYAVASVADALAPYCSGMNVPDAPYVLELPNVLHLATDVTAVAGPERTSLGLAAALHPSAAVCGTPTDRARETIAELEHLDRERYAGPVGWIDAQGDGEWGIALRCGIVDETDPRQIRLFAGCGVVAGSDPQAELTESNAKLVPMRDALG